jgi:hypothetical protein
MFALILNTLGGVAVPRSCCSREVRGQRAEVRGQRSEVRKRVADFDTYPQMPHVSLIVTTIFEKC